MVDVSMLSQIITAINSVRDLAIFSINSHNEATIRSRLQEINKTLMSVQESAISTQMQMNELIDKNRILQKKIDDLDEWNEIKSKYVLKDYGNETFAYTLVENNNNEPDHKLCPTCFQKRTKAILHFDYKSGTGRNVYKCLECNTTTNLGSRTEQWVAKKHESSWMA